MERLAPVSLGPCPVHDFLFAQSAYTSAVIESIKFEGQRFTEKFRLVNSLWNDRTLLDLVELPDNSLKR